MPMIDEIFKMMNESMPNQQLVIPRSDTSDIPDCNEIDLESFKWYEVGEIICMLQRLENDLESPVLGKLCSSLCHNCYTYFTFIKNTWLFTPYFFLFSVLTGPVAKIGMHTFTISYVRAKGTSYFMATEHFSHAKLKSFDKIEDATLFIFWKFARCLDEALSYENQVSFALVNTTNAFISVIELWKSLTESKKNMFSKWNLIYDARPNRRARSKAPINYSDDKPDDMSKNQTLYQLRQTMGGWR